MILYKVHTFSVPELATQRTRIFLQEFQDNWDRILCKLFGVQQSYTLLSLRIVYNVGFSLIWSWWVTPVFVGLNKTDDWKSHSLAKQMLLTVDVEVHRVK
jgi:hypothetical protein